MKTPIRFPADAHPTLGQRVRFVYRFSGSTVVDARWPDGIRRQVDNVPFFSAKETDASYVASERAEVVDVTITALPSKYELATLEAMVGSVRSLSVSQDGTTGDLVYMEYVTADENTGASRSASVDGTPTVWGGPAPIDTVDTSAPGFGDYLGDIFSSVAELPGAVGGAAGDLAKGALNPQVLILLGIVGTVAIFYLRKEG